MRHLSEADIGFVSEKRNKYLEEAKDKGLPTEEEKLKILNDQDIWTEKEEGELKTLEEEIANQEQTLKNLVIKSQKQILNSKILVNKKKLSQTIKERKEALDLTCEEYGERKSQEEIIYYKRNSLYSKEFNYLFEHISLKQKDFFHQKLGFLFRKNIYSSFF